MAEMTSSERQRLLRTLKKGPKLGRKELAEWMLRQFERLKGKKDKQQ